MTERPDPSDIAALEGAVNDSATRVSTIWISYLIFALYLAVAIGGTTHRQILLNEPIKLPALNIDLPLFGFFVLAPALFVIFHFYVLLQVLLLGRTAAVYNDAVDKAFGPTPDNALMRQRLTNTLFAQIFAGSPREREGWLGALLGAMAWITLAFAPICIILGFEFAFLPYHSHFATWLHRLLLLVELAIAFLLWPLVLDARQDFSFDGLRARAGGVAAAPFRLLFARGQRRAEWQRLRLQAVPVAACLLFVVSLGLVSFPGEPHLNLLTGHPIDAVACDRWISQAFDRLELSGVAVIDIAKLARIEQAAATRNQAPYEGERTGDFSGRDLTCGDFASADLRRASFAGALMSGAHLGSAVLQGADLAEADLSGDDMSYAQLQGASLHNAHLEGANLVGAQLAGADVGAASLQGANLHHAQLQGANLEEAELQGADLFDAQLQGANLSGAELQGAAFRNAQLQGANLTEAKLQGADLLHAQLQGTDLSDSELKFALISDAYVWRAAHAICSDAQVGGPNFDRVTISYKRMGRTVRKDPMPTEDYIERVVSQVPGFAKDQLKKTLHDRLAATLREDDLAAVDATWRDCAVKTTTAGVSAYFRQRADFLRDLVCKETNYPAEIATGIIGNWIPRGENANNPSGREFASLLARGLLGLDGKPCAATKNLATHDIDLLRQSASPPTAAAN